MTAFSNYLENELLDHTLGVGAYTAPSLTYIALFTAGTLLEAGTLTDECTGGAYARTTATFAAAASGTSTNSVQIDFPTATAAWGTVSHSAVCDAATSTEILYHGSLAANKIVSSGDSFKYNVGECQISLD
jgi:hypothetical protein